MNFYKHYIGDYQRDTGHLSMTEHGAYRSLLDHHYATEKPLPLDMQALYRLSGAFSKLERDAVSRVIGEFFTKTDDGYVSQRAVKEMGKADHQREVNRQIAVERESRKRSNESTTNRGNDVSTNRSTNDQPNQTPDTRQDLKQTSSAPTDPADRPAPEKSAGKQQHVISFADGQFSGLNGFADVWRRAYPAISIDVEVAKAAAWLVANPKNRKSNYARFLTNWLARAQDKAPAQGGGSDDSLFRGAI